MIGIAEATRKNVLCRLAKEADIKAVVVSWLKYAHDREGGRKRRRVQEMEAAAATPTAELAPATAELAPAAAELAPAARATRGPLSSDSGKPPFTSRQPPFIF